MAINILRFKASLGLLLGVLINATFITGQPSLVPGNFASDIEQKILAAAPEAIQKAIDNLDSVKQRQLFPPFCGRSLSVPSVPLQRHHAFLAPTERTLANAQLAFAVEHAMSSLASSTGASPAEIDNFSRQIPVGSTALGQRCPAELQDENVRCNPNATARSPDGRCNNLRKPLWGAAGTAFARLIPPQYDDGISSPRVKSANGGQLPSARRVSTCTSPFIDVQSTNVTLALVYLGQFIDHDLTLTPMSKTPGQNSPPICCNVPDQCRNPECFPVAIPEDDPSFTGRDRCMEFSRSLPALRESCRLGHREQVTEPTQYLDNSQIYGNDANRLQQVRAFRDGLLKVSTTTSAQHFDGASSSNELLPADETTSGCQQAGTDRHCFFAGDTRVNEQPMLAAYHTVFLREHNRIARLLKTVAEKGKLSTNDNDLFHATRHIINAIYQHIVYNEFVPAVLGEENVHGSNNEIVLCSHGSNDRAYCNENGYYTGYDDHMPPHVLNEFATAGFRFGHTLLRDKLFRSNLVNGVANNADDDNNLDLADNFFRPFALFDRDGVSSLMHGCTMKNSDAFDSTLVRAVRDELFRDQGQRLGFDLLAFDVQRSRDHGIPPYNKYRELCGLGRFASFDDLAKQLGNEAADRFRCAYASVDDIDLFPGSLAERPTGSTGVVGPTFACIIAQQFHQSKKGDRFWFERPNFFTPAQLDELRKAQLSRLICDNTDIMRIQPWVLWKMTIGGTNDEVGCSELPAINLDEFASMLPERGPSNDQQEQQEAHRPQPSNNNRRPPSSSNNNGPPPGPSPSAGGFNPFGNMFGGGGGGGVFNNIPFLGGGGGSGGGFFGR